MFPHRELKDSTIFDWIAAKKWEGLNVPAGIIKPWKSRENVIRRRRIPRALSVLLGPNRPEKRHAAEKTTRYSRTTFSLVCQRKTASISFCPDLLPRPRNQFSAGLSATLILLLKRSDGNERSARVGGKEKNRRSTFRGRERWKKSKSTGREGNTSVSILTNKSANYPADLATMCVCVCARAPCLIEVITTRPSYYKSGPLRTFVNS